MKNTLLFIFISFFYINASAQIDASGGLDEKLSFGLKLGIGTSKIDFNDDRYPEIASNGLGHFSVFLNKPIIEKFSIQAGLSYTDRGFDIVEQRITSNSFTIIASSFRLFYIEVPVNAVLKLPVGRGNVILGGGPYAAYALGGNVEMNTIDFVSASTEKVEKRKLSYGNKITDDFKTSDFGVNLLAGYQFKKGWLLNINYSQGFLNILPEEQTNNGAKATNSAFHFCVGYEF